MQFHVCFKRFVFFSLKLNWIYTKKSFWSIFYCIKNESATQKMLNIIESHLFISNLNLKCCCSRHRLNTSFWYDDPGDTKIISTLWEFKKKIRIQINRLWVRWIFNGMKTKFNWMGIFPRIISADKTKNPISINSEIQIFK